MKYYLSLLVALCCLSAPALAQTPEVHKEVEQMPLYRADCGDDTDYSKQKACADKAMLTYVYESIRYPIAAHRQKAEGMVVISFVVEKDGTISSPSIYRDQVGYGAGEEVLRIVNAMNENGPSWRPGMQDGQPVRVEFKLPVKFKLS